MWSGARILAGSLGEAFPSFIRSSIEWGLPSEAATQLVAQSAVTRPAAIAIARATGSSWTSTVAWVSDASEEELVALGLTTLDIDRVIGFKERQQLFDEYFAPRILCVLAVAPTDPGPAPQGRRQVPGLSLPARVSLRHRAPGVT